MTLSTTTRSRRRLAGFGCLALAVGVLAVTARAQQQRTLGTPGANQLTIDFLAVTADGSPITDLKAEDLTLRISGKPRPVRALNLVKMSTTAAAPAAAPAPAAAASATSAPAPFATNSGAARNASGRAFFIAVDNESIRPGGEGPIRDALNGFLSKLSAEDQVALVTIPHGGVNVDLTNDLAKVRAGVTQITGAAKANESVADATDRSRNSLMQFTGILEAMAGNDRPAVAILMSTSLLGAQTTGTANQASSTSGVGSLNADLTSDDFSHVRAAAAAARAEVYTVQPPGAPVMDSSAQMSRNSASRSASVDPQGGLQNIAGASGGQLFQLALSNETALDRVVRETSSYYVATIDAEADDRNGTTHPISIKATRNDVTLRVRPDMYVAKAAATGTKSVSVQDMLKTSDKFTQLPIRMAGFTTKLGAAQGGDKDKLFVTAVTEPVEPGVKFASASAGLYDSAGKLVTHDTSDTAGLAAMPLNSRMQVAPGKYRLRVAVTDASGRAGAADFPIDVSLIPGGPFQMSSMRLGTMQNNSLKTMLQFSNEPEVVAFFELFGGAANQQLFLEFDVAKSVDGPAIQQITPTPLAQGDHYLITGTVALKDLPPGDYVVRAKVGVEGQTGLLTHTLRKVQ
jgi:VWFA-related protein